MVKELLLKNRSYRRFFEDYRLEENVLRELVDLARLSSSGANLQSLKYMLSSEPERNNTIFATLGWAGYLNDWDGPVEGERPSGYIVMLFDTSLSKTAFWDHGIAAQSILLGAVERGLGGCMFGNVARDLLRQSLGIDERYEILMVIAIGKPKEEVRLVPLGPDGDVKYYRDSAGVHYVPKRSLDEIILA
ncbi:MAG: nitroreductase family protein [Desulfuromonadales bacterium]|nr:nitroreductase family protein [Desulfuromonadales bacterium]